MTHKATKIVLLVEDDPFIAMDASDTIEESGLSCIVAHDCRSALRSVENQQPGCVLLDFDLGRENSAPIAVALEKSGVPYCFISGRDSSEIRAATGLNPEVYTKPVNYARVAQHLLAGA